MNPLPFPNADIPRFECECFLPVGSWRLNVRATRIGYAATLGSLLRQPLDRPVQAEVDVELYLRDMPRGSEMFPETLAPHAQIAEWEMPADGVRTLYTGWLRVYLDRTRIPNEIHIFVREPQYSERAFRDHLFEIFCKLLFTFDRFYIHAAALEFQDRVNLFVARGSNGKTTLALRLAREGATILSEDHIVLRRDAANRFWASGAQETMRVTAKSEPLVGTSLDMAAVESSGGPKKEFRAADYFRSEPYCDFPIHRIFFNTLGDTFSIQPMTPQAAQLQMIYMTRNFFRHNDPKDLETYLLFFGALVRDKECHALRLSPDLKTLDRLVEFLHARGESL